MSSLHEKHPTYFQTDGNKTMGGIILITKYPLNVSEMATVHKLKISHMKVIIEPQAHL